MKFQAGVNGGRPPAWRDSMPVFAQVSGLQMAGGPRVASHGDGGGDHLHPPCWWRWSLPRWRGG